MLLFSGENLYSHRHFIFAFSLLILCFTSALTQGKRIQAKTFATQTVFKIQRVKVRLRDKLCAGKGETECRVCAGINNLCYTLRFYDVHCMIKRQKARKQIRGILRVESNFHLKTGAPCKPILYRHISPKN